MAFTVVVLVIGGRLQGLPHDEVDAVGSEPSVVYLIVASGQFDVIVTFTEPKPE